MLKKVVLATAMMITCAHMPALAKSNNSCGKASWYALNSKTASGEKMRSAELTAAHRSLKFGTKLKVVNKRNGKSVIVRVNDRGPFIRDRVLDVSKGAAHHLGIVSSGVGSVCYEIVSR